MGKYVFRESFGRNPTERHRKFVDEYYRYAQMAAFPGYTESTLLVGMGLLGTGADTIEGETE